MTQLYQNVIYILCKNISSSKQWRTEVGFSGFKPPETPKVLQNRAKLTLIVKIV